MKLDNIKSKSDGEIGATKPTVESKAKNRTHSKGAKSGRWTQAEKLTFLMGLKQFGKGKWKEISTLIPTRSTIQVKTHAQMVMKRVEAGEDIFAELHNSWGYNGLDASTHRHDNKEKTTLISPSASVQTSNKTMDTTKLYDDLSQSDQGAVRILYEMTRPQVN